MQNHTSTCFPSKAQLQLVAKKQGNQISLDMIKHLIRKFSFWFSLGLIATSFLIYIVYISVSNFQLLSKPIPEFERFVSI